MAETETPSSSRPPQQISEMFTKFAIAFKTKTFELFADEEEGEGEEDDNDDPTSTTAGAATATTSAAVDGDMFTLLDSAEEFITDQKVVVLKPDNPLKLPKISRTQFAQTLISSLFATVSSFEASYLSFQTAHVPKIDEKALEAADKALVSILRKFSDLRNVYRDFRKNPGGNFELPDGSFLEFQVQENQSKLRALETMVNQLILHIESKDEQVLLLRKKLDKTIVLISNLSKKLVATNGKSNKGTEIVFTVRVFESFLRDCVKSCHIFTKLLIALMRKAGWDLEMAANSVYPDARYAKTGHYKYAFLSHVCLGMFRGFDLGDFGLLCSKDETLCNGNGLYVDQDSYYLKQLIEHSSSNPIEILGKDPRCCFSLFCEQKYEQLIHPTMESSLFSSFDQKEAVLNSWKSISVFYESFVKMSSSVWLLHKLAYSFNPVVEIFQVEKGAAFSLVYMEDVPKRESLLTWKKTRPTIEFTVVPGFKIGRTIIQSEVYLSATSSCTES